MSSLKVYLYTASLYQGQKMVCTGEFPDLSVFPMHSLEIPYGVGVNLYSGVDYTGTVQTLTTSVPSLSKTRLDNLPVKSIKIWSTANWKVSGKWLIKAPTGQYLTIRSDRHYGNVLGTKSSFDEDTFFNVSGYTAPCASGIAEQSVSMSVPYTLLAKLPQHDPRTLKEGGITSSNLASVVMVDEGGSRFSMRLGNQWIGLSGVRAIKTPTYENRVIFTRFVRLAEHEGNVGSLNSGEAALFENPGYWAHA